jgi:hypothetical protein
MRELRTQIVESEFVKLVRKLEKGGYHLVFLRELSDVKAVEAQRPQRSEVTARSCRT